jgi:hypothetical protein
VWKEEPASAAPNPSDAGGGSGDSDGDGDSYVDSDGDSDSGSWFENGGDMLVVRTSAWLVACAWTRFPVRRRASTGKHEILYSPFARKAHARVSSWRL